MYCVAHLHGVKDITFNNVPNLVSDTRKIISLVKENTCDQELE
jgi:hypothetical protein